MFIIFRFGFLLILPYFSGMKFELDTRKHTQSVEHFQKMFNLDISEASLENITKILRHFARLPYENLSKIIKLNQNWDSHHFRLPEEVIDGHDRFRLGGTCFSLTFTLKSILDYFGYDCYFLMADMRSGKNTHSALVLRNNGEEFLVDPGYLLSKPQKIDPANSSNSLIRRSGENGFSLWTPNGTEMKKRYSFIKTPTATEDFHQHWENSFHWMTMHGICLSKRDENGFVYLHNHYIKREGSDFTYKGKFKEEISEIAKKYFDIPDEVVKKAEFALKENLYYDKELGYRVPKWVK